MTRAGLEYFINLNMVTVEDALKNKGRRSFQVPMFTESRMYRRLQSLFLMHAGLLINGTDLGPPPEVARSGGGRGSG